MNPFKLFYLFRVLIVLLTVGGGILLTTGTLALIAALFGIAPFAFVSQLQIPYVGVYVAPYLAMIDGPLTQYAVAQVLGSGLLGLAGAGAAMALGLWLLRRVVMSLCRGIMAAAVAAFRSPVATYRGIVRARNWLLAKVEYLQAESQRWVTLFRIARLPYSALRGLGFSPQMAATLLFAGSAVGTGVVVNETLLEGRSFSRGDPGTYMAPGDQPVSFVADPKKDGYNTLRLDLGTTAVKSILIDSASIGTAFTNSTLPSGQTTAISIGGDGSLSTPTWLIVGEMTFSKNRCETLTLSHISVHELNVTSNLSDGQSLSPVAGTIRNRAVLGGHGMAQDMAVTGGLYDRILIQANTTAVNGQIDQLTLNNVYSRGGDCLLTRIKAGTLTLDRNVIGGDSDLATKAFTIATSVSASVINLTDNVEEVMAVPSVQTMDS
ncbi:hypothetical protein [uncultured Mediterranean phage uvDeep-CGR2-KM21-C338]|nr:hypothetical protein [uncultured Mediterranean phage uvDeep-CGR2-KM21-C338]